MIAKDEARVLILEEWKHWINRHPDLVEPSGTDGLTFFGYLQRERPALLNFRNRGDKWQTIHGWLLRERLVSS